VETGIKYEDLAYTSFNGFASVGTNNGKNGTRGLPFYNHPETVIDFAWRSYVANGSRTGR
jgi:feruloyl esterase